MSMYLFFARVHSTVPEKNKAGIYLEHPSSSSFLQKSRGAYITKNCRGSPKFNEQDNQSEFPN